ncbi:MAG: tRNA (adenosine(37)-N6)-threonylcarbamoyltransferase complex transferase subunit TsaD, partial [Bacteroidetes bacterium]|nr:tRNA (adenosine(37)-N6)-threonylcarbamoyltransferase complex transferase subunit TsaD [Bacteroidota bacterium]
SLEILGKTIDDAAGEAFDKAAKIMGITYPGGPLIDKYAKLGNPDAFRFAKPRVSGLDYSFSGLKTSFLYFMRDRLKENPRFAEENRNDLCASIQKTIVDVLMEKLILAAKSTGISHVAIAGGVSANSALREAMIFQAKKNRWTTYVPDFQFCTDNAGMIAVTGYLKACEGKFASQSDVPTARISN